MSNNTLYLAGGLTAGAILLYLLSGKKTTPNTVTALPAPIPTTPATSLPTTNIQPGTTVNTNNSGPVNTGINPQATQYGGNAAVLVTNLNPLNPNYII